jgi:hypothetical protein
MHILQQQFISSSQQLYQSWSRMDAFDKSFGRRQPTGAEQVVGIVLFGDMIWKMINAFGDLDRLVKANPQ